jgi:hypothetical protein
MCPGALRFLGHASDSPVKPRDGTARAKPNCPEPSANLSRVEVSDARTDDESTDTEYCTGVILNRGAKEDRCGG